MPAEPQIKPLSYARRTWVFRTFLLIFLVVLPVIIFYAMGYRFNFTDGDSSIISTGGLYVSMAVDDAEIYIDEELVEDIRVFRNASYIQNLNAGVHRVHTQGPGLYTWVKDLPVQAHIVTEVQAFNMPLVPQIRLIAPWLNLSGVGVYDDVSTSTLAANFSFASTTRSVTASTTIATSTLFVNEEHDYVVSLFGTSTKEETIVGQIVQEVNDAFTFSGATTTASTTAMATTTVVERSTKLYERDGEIYVSWTGRDNDIPYYFCVDHKEASTTRKLYGEHVLDSLMGVVSGIPETETQQVTKRVCRDEIRIDRKWQQVTMFTFMPGTTDLVLMQLEDGLYVVEVDDRSWQNTQQLYPHGDIEVVVDSDRIYIHDGLYYLELFTEIESS